MIWRSGKVCWQSRCEFTLDLHFILSTWQISIEEFILPRVLSPFTICSHPGGEGSRNSSALTVAHLSSETDSGKIRANGAFASVAFAVLSPTWQYLGQYHNRWWKHRVFLNFLEWILLADSQPQWRRGPYVGLPRLAGPVFARRVPLRVAFFQPLQQPVMFLACFQTPFWGLILLLIKNH